MAANNSTGQPCSPQNRDCGVGLACFASVDGFTCRANTTAGCALGPRDYWPKAINQPLIKENKECQHCPIPKDTAVRQQLLGSPYGIMDDGAWSTFGNCERGYCGLDGVCRSPKPVDALCLAASQCDSQYCTSSNARTGQVACVTYDGKPFQELHNFVGIMVIIIGASLLGCGIVGTLFARFCRKPKVSSAACEHASDQGSAMAVVVPPAKMVPDVVKRRRYLVPSCVVMVGSITLLSGLLYYYITPEYSNARDNYQ